MHRAADYIPLNDLARTYSRQADKFREVVERTLQSGWWLNGKEVAAFCQAFAHYVGVKHCVGVANGTDALEIAIRAILCKHAPQGKEVITVSNAGGYSTIACRLLGLTPAYADIDYETQLVSIESALSLLSSETALVIVTHLYGGAVDVPLMRQKMDNAGFSHVPILEDCAQAHGARVGEKLVGSLGEISTFSFYPTKNLGAFGDGGAVLTSDEQLASIVGALRQYGWEDKYRIARPGGRNSRLDEVQAAILLVQLPHLDVNNDRRMEILRRYESVASKHIQFVRSPLSTVAHLAVALCEQRDALRAYLKELNIATDIHYPILDCDQSGWKKLPQRIAQDGLVNARRSVERLITLPSFPTMTDEEVDRICEALARWKN